MAVERSAAGEWSCSGPARAEIQATYPIATNRQTEVMTPKAMRRLRSDTSGIAMLGCVEAAADLGLSLRLGTCDSQRLMADEREPCDNDGRG